MMMLRRKMVMLRWRMLGRRTDPKIGTHTLCENLQAKCRGPKPRPTLCASLHSRNALGRFTRAILCPGPDGAPSSSTGL